MAATHPLPSEGRAEQEDPTPLLLYSRGRRMQVQALELTSTCGCEKHPTPTPSPSSSVPRSKHPGLAFAASKTPPKRGFSRLRGKDSNLDYLIQSYRSPVTVGITV